MSEIGSFELLVTITKPPSFVVSAVVSAQPLASVKPTEVSVGGANATTPKLETSTVTELPVSVELCGVRVTLAFLVMGMADEKVAVQVLLGTNGEVQVDETKVTSLVVIAIFEMSVMPLFEMVMLPV